PRRPRRRPLLAARSDRLAVNERAATRRGPIDRFAVLTYVLAALWLLGIGSLLSLYFGRLSLRRTQTQHNRRGRTVTWAGIAVPIFGLALAALWIVLSLSA